MKLLSQREIARSLGCSAMTVNRHLMALRGNDAPLTDEAALLVFAVPEIMEAGFATSVAIQLLVDHRQEIQFLSEDQTRRCWIAFVTTGPDGFEMQLSVLRSQLFEDVIDRHPVSLILPLHVVVARASERLAAAKASRRTAA